MSVIYYHVLVMGQQALLLVSAKVFFCELWWVESRSESMPPSDHAFSFTWPDLSYSGLVVPRSKSSIPVMIILVLFCPLLLFNFHLVLTGFFVVELLFVNKYACDTNVLGFGWGHAYLLLDAVMGRVSFVGLLRSVLLLIRSGWAWIVSLSVNEFACVEP